MDTLLDITLKSRLVEKLSVALYDCLFEVEDSALEREAQEGDGESYVAVLEESDHMAVASVHAFLQNLYFYASENNEEFRSHMLVETLLIPRLVLPYLDRCVLHATILNSRAEAYADVLEGDRIAEMALHNPQLVKGIAASLRTLIIASFRAPATQFVMSLLRRLNPTAQMLRASAFCRHHEYIFALLCLLNVNMGALDLSRSGGGSAGDEEGEDSYNAHTLLHELATVYADMDAAAQGRVYKRVMCSGALPISRDTPSYVAVMSVLHGGAAAQLEYLSGRTDGKEDDDDENYRDTRAEAKMAHASRLAHLQQQQGGSEGVDAPVWDDKAGERDKKDSTSKAEEGGVEVASAAAASSASTIAYTKAEAKGGGGASARGEYKERERDADRRLLGDLPGEVTPHLFPSANEFQKFLTPPPWSSSFHRPRARQAAAGARRQGGSFTRAANRRQAHGQHAGPAELAAKGERGPHHPQGVHLRHQRPCHEGARALPGLGPRLRARHHRALARHARQCVPDHQYAVGTRGLGGRRRPAQPHQEVSHPTDEHAHGRQDGGRPVRLLKRRGRRSPTPYNVRV